MTTTATQKPGALIPSNSAGDRIAPAVMAALAAGTKGVTRDCPIPSGKVQSVFVAQVDFGFFGGVMVDMARAIPRGAGAIAVPWAAPDAANRNARIEAMKATLAADAKDTDIRPADVVRGDDPPEGRCDKVRVSGLGVPPEGVSCAMNGCAPEVVRWDFRDLGDLSDCTACGLATGTLTREIGETLIAGRMGSGTIEADPGHEGAKRILMAPFTASNAAKVGTVATSGARPARSVRPRIGSGAAWHRPRPRGTPVAEAR